MIGSQLVEAIVLGVIQGIAEFLPISSSGHLVLADALLKELFGTDFGGSESLTLNIALHVGTLGSILAVYREDILRLARQPKVLLAIVAATIPTAVAGLTWKEQFERLFETPLTAGCGLFVTAVLLLIGQRWQTNRRVVEELRQKDAVAVGLFQALALVPGISRSGSTIAGGLLVGLQREAATSFSFFIAIPAIAGAAVLTAADLSAAAVQPDALLPILCGMLISFVVGLLSLKWLIRIVSQRKLHWFAYYCFLVSGLTWLWQLVKG